MTKRGAFNLKINISNNNKFYNTGVANVRGTTVNQEMLYNDLGGNSNINWFNREHYNARFTTPVDSRYYSRGVLLTKANPSFAAGAEIGFLCTADHTPTVAGTWKSGIG